MEVKRRYADKKNDTKNPYSGKLLEKQINDFESHLMPRPQT